MGRGKLRILITGANGYVAKALTNYLSQDSYTVTAVSRKKFDLCNSAATNEFFKHNNFDIVIHTAVVGGSRLKADDTKVLDDNLQMYYNLLANRNRYWRLIHFGSGAELYATNTPYGLSKKIIADSILDKNNFYSLRIFGLFDEYELDSRFIKANLKRYLNNEPMYIHQDKYMTFFYMKDLFKLVEYYITTTSPPKQVDCCYSTNLSLRSISDYINTLGNHKVSIQVEVSDLGFNYVGETCVDVPIDYIGLEQGIKEVYNKLK